MGALRRMFGQDTGESQESYMRRLAAGSMSGYVKPVMPSVVDFYDRIAALEARVAELERQVGWQGPQD